jgi:hypothetical protein
MAIFEGFRNRVFALGNGNNMDVICHQAICRNAQFELLGV